MPSTKDALELLCRKTPLSDQDWLELIERRREDIRPHLGTFTLSTLGRVECLKTESFTHAIRDNSPECVGGSEFDLNTQGIFCTRYGSRIETGRGIVAPPGGINVPDGVQYIWGLTRNAQWILAGVSYIGEYGYKGRGYERATRVEIEETIILKIAAVCKYTYREIWQELGKEIHKWAAKRKALYEDALALSQACEIEETVSLFAPVEQEVPTFV